MKHVRPFFGLPMTVFERQARDSKVAFRTILPAVDPDCTRCRQNRPRNCFAVNGKQDTSKKVYLDDITVLLRECWN